jgi:hypothetical protein
MWCLHLFVSFSNSYEVILYAIFIEEIVQPKVGQASECVLCLGSFLCRTVKNVGSTDADDFCFDSPIDVFLFVINLTC